MANKTSPATPVQVTLNDHKTFDKLLDELAKRPHVRLVKVDDQGLVEAARRGSAFVMQPRVRLVATAFDYPNREILRYADKWDVGSGAVTLHAAGGGSHHDPTGKMTR